MKTSNFKMFITLALLLSCKPSVDKSSSQEKLEITDTTVLSNLIAQNNSDSSRVTQKMILVSGGQLSPSNEITISGCIFNLVTKGNDTIYLATNDKKFQTPEGYKVGMKLSELPDNIQRQLTKESGWGYYHQFDSDWAIGFCEGSSCTDNYPDNNSEVKWIFKRK